MNLYIMTQYINGPTNYAYLQGTINGMPKKIWLFMDTHGDMDNKTQCELFDSIDISQYLYKTIKYAKEPVDFFIEGISDQSNEQKETQILRYSKTNDNIRLQYLDTRDHLELFDILNIVNHDIKPAFNRLIQESDNTILIEKIIKHIEKVSSYVNVLKYNIFEITYEKKIHDKNTNKQKYYLSKTINKYEDALLKKHMTIFINDNYSIFFFILNTQIAELIEYFKIWPMKKEVDKILDNIQIINEAIIDMTGLFTDLYLLRRLLYKNSIEQSIIYTESLHSFNYIYFLVKCYDFKIIKMYNSVEKDINVIIKLIKNAVHVYSVYELFTNTKNKFIECINTSLKRLFFPDDGGARIVY